MSKLILQGYIIVSNHDLDLVQSELSRHIELTREEEGCLVFTVSQDKENKNIFHVYEEFANKAAFEAHQCRVRESSWGNVTKNVERHYQITHNNQVIQNT
jgi:quinol monooxygenase YgiN